MAHGKFPDLVGLRRFYTLHIESEVAVCSTYVIFIFDKYYPVLANLTV